MLTLLYKRTLQGDIMKQIFFLHSAGPQGKHEGSSDFIAKLSEGLGPDYKIIHPVMPHSEDPDYAPWKVQLHKELQPLQGDIIFVGHSLGGAVLLKYLTEERIAARIAGIFLCATPFWGADENWQYEPFTLPDSAADKLAVIPNIYLYHSKNDPFVPFAHSQHYKHLITQAVMRPIEGYSHAFEDGLPKLVEDIKALHY